YSRYSNPNTTEFINKVCIMEGAEDGLAFSSGMAAVFASFAGFVRSGDHIVSAGAIFGSTHQLFTELFPRWGLTTSYVNAVDNEAWERAIQRSTMSVVLESRSNPGLELADLEFLGNLKKRYPEIIVISDSCFAPPDLQQPVTYGF